MQNMNPNPDTEHLTTFLANLHAKGHRPTVAGQPATLRTMSEAFIEPESCVTVRWGDGCAAHFVSDDHGTTFKPEWVTWERFLQLMELEVVA